MEAEHTSKEIQQEQGYRQFLTFALMKEIYGVDILKVHEIISVPNITRVPRTEKYVKGVFNLRGKIIPVIDLRSRLDFEEKLYDERTCIIVIKINFGEESFDLGIIVDTVLEVLTFARDEISEVPNYGTAIDTSFLTGKASWHKNVINLVDIDLLLSHEEKVSLKEMD